MKRLISVLLLLSMLPVLPIAAADSAANEVEMTFWSSSDKVLEYPELTDGSDETAVALKKSKQGSIILETAEDVAAISLRLSPAPAAIEVKQRNEKKKWISLATYDQPGLMPLLTLPEAVSGQLQVVLTYTRSTEISVMELHSYTAGELPESIRLWESADRADVLMVADTLSGIDLAQLRALTSAGRTVAAASLKEETDPAVLDALWDAGLRVMPADNGGRKDKAAMISWIRMWQPLLVVSAQDAGETAQEAVKAAMDRKADPDSASDWGLWAEPAFCTDAEDVMAVALPERSNEALRAYCVEKFAAAQHSDPAEIPYPASRLADGYLPEGEDEFVYDDGEKGLWAYLSQTLQVEIIKYHDEAGNDTWFEAEITFKPEAEQIAQHVYLNATFRGQQIYPETLAQTSKLVFGVNGDYYPYRVEKGMNVGNIIRQREVLYNMDPKRSLKYPNLDTVALRDDGTMSVYTGKEISADELLAQGDVHDSLSFGPYLVRDSRLRIYNGNSADVQEPRSAFGMVEAGHYFFVMVEGKMPKNGEQGFTLPQLSEVLYARGVNEAINIDGGSTAVMLFMGHKLNRTGKGNSLGSPRNQHELFGIGQTELVYTDMVDGRKK